MVPRHVHVVNLPVVLLRPERPGSLFSDGEFDGNQRVQRRAVVQQPGEVYGARVRQADLSGGEGAAGG